MQVTQYFMLASHILHVLAYTNNLYTIINFHDIVNDTDCGGFKKAPSVIMLKEKLNMVIESTTQWTSPIIDMTFQTVGKTAPMEKDPVRTFEKVMQRFLFGHKKEANKESYAKTLHAYDENVDIFAHFPVGNVLRAELFQNKSSVHLPITQFIHRGHCYLDISKDYMQTAVNAFSIFLEGDLDDISRLHALYVLRSARTIAMMKIAREKLAATWSVVKGDMDPEDVSYQMLEMYRPLFKYLNGREMARLNLSNERILSYIGTHAELDRHQVGVVASRYIQLNPRWREPKYLNLMNNLLCGVPMNFMRKVPENTYLQLAHQLFYHIKACDALQRRFYLAMMTRTQALGKSYSWSAPDVSRLGLLLTEVEGPDLSAIKPEAMSGITAQVMMEMPVHNLKHITEMQLRYIAQKPLSILAKKLKNYEDQMQILNSASKTMHIPSNTLYFINIKAFSVILVGANSLINNEI